jgi:hypothetical protein
MIPMSQPVKLSDTLVLEARLAGEVVTRSIAGQVEFWASLGRAIDPVLNGAQAMALLRRGQARPLQELLDDVAQPVGAERLREHLGQLPFPHYAPHPTRPGLLIRTDSDGSTTTGRFVHRAFVPAADG